MKDISGWYYYNHAWLPDTSPDEKVDTSIVESGEIWKGIGKKSILARWTDNFDCENETQWWYVIKDKPFDIMSVDSNIRYKIRKGLRLFDVHLIEAADFREDIYNVQLAAYSGYPKKYRPAIDKNDLFNEIDTLWKNESIKIYGAFFRENNDMAGYIYLKESGRCIGLVSQKVKPEYEKYQVNASLVAMALEELSEKLSGGYYISDGARNIQHETAFQDYLEKYFGFRKAYAFLNVKYNPRYKIFVKALYPFRKMLKKLNGIGVVHRINGVLCMEEIVRIQKKTF